MADEVITDAVTSGDHACLTFTDLEERLDLVAAFVRDGLREGSKVLCWTDGEDPEQLATALASRSVRAGRALKRGQLRITPSSASLLSGDGGAEQMVANLAGELSAAAQEGYPGLRVTADMGWATRPLAPAAELLAFESAVTEAGLFSDGRLCLICQYHRDRFDAVTLAFAAKAHPKNLAAQVYFEHPLLRICRQYSPAGLRIAGELDFRHRDVLDQALGESLRLDRHPHVNLGGLGYLDGACAGSIVAAAGRLPPSRRMTVTCRRVVATVLQLVGADGVAHLRVLAADEQR